jgi:hypothetical protein
LLVSYFHGLAERFKAKRIIASQLETIRKSEEELRALKCHPDADQPNAKQESSSAENGGV